MNGRNSMKSKSHYCAEVIESSLYYIKAECWSQRVVPLYGALVAIDEKEATFYGVVYASYAHADEAFRAVNAYQKTEDELRAEQPQIFAFLKTSFQLLILGSMCDGCLSYSYASEPIHLHSFVRSACKEEYQQFFLEPRYLSLIFSQEQNVGNVDELLLHMVSNMRKHDVSKTAIEEMVDQYFILNGSDYSRLRLFSSRLQRFV